MLHEKKGISGDIRNILTCMSSMAIVFLGQKGVYLTKKSMQMCRKAGL